ncbi:DUF2489 domain-containing protein [Larsenimonas rhizosphaerae]|uniref:DUF2489 domain-containing protein n=1 Tax=Larsenimonas rhizosphaerae TaxID=2944682 RepID=A0AA42CTV2_9GAMM|nr:DUF2489 domain-containing protein [Larsenimonas rhizosphaerae]MCM2130742.1 DUF2489 domain-containing protein [Larsenimonas rhizosphaerae]MCX2523446.1 DUF2489 domain-containing protein [Larsenimonas rhizosphaerae]
MSAIWLWVILAACILTVAGLALYAHRLWKEVRVRQARAASEVERARVQCLANLDVISRAMLADQVDLVEGVLRACVIIDILDSTLFEREPLKVLPEIREKTAHLHTHQSRSELPARERMKEDRERLNIAGNYRDRIHAAAMELQGMCSGLGVEVKDATSGT